jgi:putative hydrolase of the HAD superfamily
VFRAVVFDLWVTLVTVPGQAFAEFRRGWARQLQVPVERLEEIWFSADVLHRLEKGPIRSAILEIARKLDIEVDVDAVVSRRLELMRDALVPDDGVVETLIELRRRRLPTGLISNCTEDVPLVWDESPFAGLFDVAVFSASAGCAKPDRRIYELALGQLPTTASETLFVGDGANNELEGARSVGMTPVLVHPPGEKPAWDGLEDWTGLRITEIPQVLDLVV